MYVFQTLSMFAPRSKALRLGNAFAIKVISSDVASRSVNMRRLSNRIPHPETAYILLEARAIYMPRVWSGHLRIKDGRNHCSNEGRVFSTVSADEG